MQERLLATGFGLPAKGKSRKPRSHEAWKLNCEQQHHKQQSPFGCRLSAKPNARTEKRIRLHTKRSGDDLGSEVALRAQGFGNLRAFPVGHAGKEVFRA